MLEQLEKSEALSEKQYNKIVFICKENAQMQSNEIEYKYKIRILTEALSSTRRYLDNYVDVDKEFAFNNPPSSQFMIIDAALKEGLRSI